MQLIELRLAIEPAGVKLAALNATEEDKKDIRFKYLQLEMTFGDETKSPKADYDFHHSILLAAHNELMVSLIQTLREVLIRGRQMNISMRKKGKRDDQREAYKTLLLHKAVMEAVCAGEAELAQQKMYELLQRIVERVKVYPVEV